MATSGLSAENLPEYVAAVSKLREEWYPVEQTWGPWFRGQSNADWELMPNLYRHWHRPRVINKTDRNMEDELRQEFMVRAPSFTEARPQSTWSWYFLMQHSGAPTRLVDWTEGALIALYFAVRDNKGDFDAAVWALDPWWLNELVLGRADVFCPEALMGMAIEDTQLYDDWLPPLYVERSAIPELPAAIYPAYTAQRISTQRSCFTIHGSERCPFERLADTDGKGLRKIVIPKTAVRSLQQQLLTCGVDEVTIYPDLDGLGRYLSTVLRAETQGTQLESQDD